MLLPTALAEVTWRNMGFIQFLLQIATALSALHRASSSPLEPQPHVFSRQQPPPPPPGNTTLSVCSPLLNNLGSPTVLTPFEFEFRTAANNAWNLYNTLFMPTCIIHPQTAEDVSRVMKAIYEAGGVKYAVQAGGHSAMREWDTYALTPLL